MNQQINKKTWQIVNFLMQFSRDALYQDGVNPDSKQSVLEFVLKTEARGYWLPGWAK